MPMTLLTAGAAVGLGVRCMLSFATRREEEEEEDITRKGDGKRRGRTENEL